MFISFSVHHQFSACNKFFKVSGLSAIDTRSSAYKRALTWYNPKVMPLAFFQAVNHLIDKNIK